MFSDHKNFVFLAILINVREVVQLSGSWDDERDALGELHKLVLPPLMACLDYDIQKVSEDVKVVIDQGVSIFLSSVSTGFLKL